MAAWWSGSVAAFLDAEPERITERLALAQARHYRINDQAQLRAWMTELVLLASALRGQENAGSWHVLLEYPLLRLGRRIDAVLLTDRLIIAIEFKIGAEQAMAAALQQAEDYALDLFVFHAGSRAHPVVPLLVAENAPSRAQQAPLLLGLGVVHPVLTNATGFGDCIAQLQAAAPRPAQALDGHRWEHAPYRPVPTIIEAAQMLYARNSVAEIAAARADLANLRATTRTILDEIAAAQHDGVHAIIFVTGIPGAGKTLCGLNVVFGIDRLHGATFLTGNPTLVHVLREALARNAANGDRKLLSAARHRVQAQIQELPRFRDYHLGTGEVPPEHVAVIDEAQRTWRRDHAVLKSRDRTVKLADSEPACLLDIMASHVGWSAIVCLVGGGQEIHTGEGGLEEWGVALRARPYWRVVASPHVLQAADLRQRLPDLPGIVLREELHLHVPARNIRSERAAHWVDAMLAGDADLASSIADEGPLPFLLTRDLAALRAALRHSARGTRRAGLVASSGAARLRADGLGVELPHMDAQAVARWFLDGWPADVRASDALEVVATEFSCQGLELDYVGLCWGGDLIRRPGGAPWVVRNFSGTDWQAVHKPEAASNRRNTYRVLLTRARYETVIFVPRGAAEDRTRNPDEFDAVATYLRACGARELEVVPHTPDVPGVAEGMLL